MTKKEIEIQCDIAWAEKYLELTGHKIGDEVTCNFSCNIGNAKQAYLTNTQGKGVIVKTDKGLFVKSNNKVMKAHSEKRRLSDRNSIWVYTEEYDYARVQYIVEPKEKENES